MKYIVVPMEGNPFVADKNGRILSSNVRSYISKPKPSRIPSIKPTYPSTSLIFHSCTLLHIHQTFDNLKKLLDPSIASTFAVDIVLGQLTLLALYSLFNHYKIDRMFFLGNLRSAMCLFQSILQWLQNNPLGLKLNVPVVKHISWFFSQQANVWFAIVLETVPSPIATTLISVLTASLAGLGLSTFLCLLADLSFSSTICFYLFHTFMAKIYSLAYSLLWKLTKIFFVGRYNPLKGRQDYENSIYQLYTATLLLTIVLFLMPTFVVFYSVFAGFRLIVMLFGECFPMWIYKSIWSAPIYETYFELRFPAKIPRKRYLDGDFERMPDGSSRIRLAEVLDVPLTEIKRRRNHQGRFVFMAAPSALKILKDFALGRDFRAELVQF